MSASPWQLHEKLAADTFALGDYPLCRLLLMNDSNYPWFILVPRVPGAREIYLLEAADQLQLLNESSQLSAAVMKAFGGEKLNVAALGNVVPQLHVHHVVRYAGDPAWPGPVWGKVPAKPYGEAAWKARADALRPLLGRELRWGC